MPLLRWAILLLTLPSGCAAGPDRPACASPPVPPNRAAGVVFCADGSGGFGNLVPSMKQVVADARAPLCVEEVGWSHGKRRFLADHLCWSHLKKEAQQFACRVQEWHRCHPDQRIYFVGHSAGCAVVLEAAALLPCGTVDHIVLLSPSVCSRYDLRPALRCCREEIDVFYSKNDWFILGLGMSLSGTTDRRLPPVAGRVGFSPMGSSPEDEALYARVRQYPWGPEVAWTGNTGGHYGSEEPAYLRALILPLLKPTAAPPQGQQR